ncbi:MAG: hypothetical protein NT157_00265, partial [Candidatus Micrarchaeota archaeon]|nr:hypothetical protein [Candidatus Micrarchaeota archaeon]
RNSGVLRADDKSYVDFSEGVLSQLRGVGISFNRPPEEVIRTIKETFGKTGQEIVANARVMPIYGEVITEKGSLQCGDRLLDKLYESESIRALRGGDVAATAILYLTTLCTCQGISVKDFIETAKKWENEAFSSSDDTEGLKKRSMSDADIAREKAAGNFAIGEAMFTPYRHQRTPAYYLLNEQLNCIVALTCDPLNSFIEGKAPRDMEVNGALLITQDAQTEKEIAAERSVRRPITITLFKKGSESPKGVIYKPVFSDECKTDRDGCFSTSIPKGVLNDLKKGEYVVEARFEGPVRGENLDCPDKCPFEVVKPTVPQKKPEKEPMRVYVKYYFHQKVQADIRGPTSVTEENVSPGEPIPGDVLRPGLAPMCHDLLRITKRKSTETESKPYTMKFGVEKVLGNFGVHGLFQVDTNKETEKVKILAQRYAWGHFDEPPVEEKSKTVVTGRSDRRMRLGLEVGYEKKLLNLPKNHELNLQARFGGYMGNDPRFIGGLTASVGDPKKATYLAAELTDELHRQASLAVGLSKYVTSGVSATIGVDNLNTNKPVLSIGISKGL